MVPIKFVNDFYDQSVLEIEISLFYSCNLNCEFCLQAPFKSNLAIDHFPEDWLENIIERFKSAVPLYGCKKLRISFYGGELFQDKFDDIHIQKYYTLIKTLNQYARENGYTIDYELVTNLVYRKIDRMIDFVQKCECSIATSFDFSGRFVKQYQFNLWKRNVQQLLDKNIFLGIIIVGHKQNLIGLHNDVYDISFFANTNNVIVDVAEYDDVSNNLNYKLTTDEFVEFVKLLKNKYPNINLSILGNGARCGSRVLDISSHHTLLRRCDEVALTQLIIQKFNCLACPYKRQCVIVCPRKFLQNCFCPNRELYSQFE